MSQVMCRHAKDDFEALSTAQGMVNAGATVISIVYTDKERGVLAYVVYASFDPPITCDAIDLEIHKALYPDEPYDDESEDQS